MDAKGKVEQAMTYLYLSWWAPPLPLVPTVTHPTKYLLFGGQMQYLPQDCNPAPTLIPPSMM